MRPRSPPRHFRGSPKPPEVRRRAPTWRAHAACTGGPRRNPKNTDALNSLLFPVCLPPPRSTHDSPGLRRPRRRLSRGRSAASAALAASAAGGRSEMSKCGLSVALCAVVVCRRAPTVPRHRAPPPPPPPPRAPGTATAPIVSRSAAHAVHHRSTIGHTDNSVRATPISTTQPRRSIASLVTLMAAWILHVPLNFM